MKHIYIPFSCTIAVFLVLSLQAKTQDTGASTLGFTVNETVSTAADDVGFSTVDPGVQAHRHGGVEVTAQNSTTNKEITLSGISAGNNPTQGEMSVRLGIESTPSGWNDDPNGTYPMVVWDGTEQTTSDPLWGRIGPNEVGTGQVTYTLDVGDAAEAGEYTFDFTYVISDP